MAEAKLRSVAELDADYQTFMRTRSALADRAGDLESDVSIAGDLVDLAELLVGELTIVDSEPRRREQAQACSALIGVRWQLKAIGERVRELADALSRQREKLP